MLRFSFIRSCFGCEHSDLLDSYFQWLSVTFSAQTARNRLYYLHRYLHFSDDPFTPGAVVRFLGHVGTSASTRKNALDALRCHGRWRQLMGLPGGEVLQQVPSPRVSRGLPRPAPWRVVRRGVAASTRLVDELMLSLAVMAGLRAGEIARVHTDDVLGGELRVVGKGGHVRHVPLRPELQEQLNLIPRGWVFPSDRNPSGHVLASSITQRLGDLLGPGWSAHSLRHRFATEIYAGCLDIIALRDLLGHVSVDTTMVYTKFSSRSLKDAVATMDLSSLSKANSC